MAKELSDDDFQLLEALEVDITPEKPVVRSAKEERIIAGFEDIERFFEEHGRVPQHGEDLDIFERIYAVRLDRIRNSKECINALEGLDKHGLLSDDVSHHSVENDDLSDDDLLDALGLNDDPDDDITQLKHVRSREEIRAAEEIAQRIACSDFNIFKPMFERVQSDLANGLRKTSKFQDDARVEKGDLFILDGQKIFVSELGEKFKNNNGKTDRRLRVIFENGTESSMLLRSLIRALNKDKVSRRISTPELGPLFSGVAEEDDSNVGYVYILRSNSSDKFISENRDVIHKIGITGGSVERRVANAEKDPTYLLAGVEVVETFQLSNLNRKRLEKIIHRFFRKACLDVQLKDRFGFDVEPKEWFLVPLPVIEDAIQKLMAGTIGDYEYDPKIAKIVRAE